MFKATADIKTSDQLHLPVPEAKFETVVVKPSEIQQDMVQALSERAAKVHSGCVDPAVDNMLKITSDGRKIGLDQRLMNDALPDDPNSKLNACVRNVLKIWAEGKEQKLTQLIFCDMSTPKGAGSFNVYDDIRAKLLSASVPEQEIAFIHNADTEEKKSTLFSKVRSGDVRILLGSTAKMGAGTNVQTRLVAVHHLDVGWRPSDMTQRNGRIIRQGNQNKQVYVYNYVTESTFDAFELNIRFDSFKNEHQAVLRAELSYPVSLGDDARGNIVRLDNAIDNFADRIADAENALQNLEQQKQAAELEVAKPFAQEEELQEKSARLAELNALLNIDHKPKKEALAETAEAAAPRPSVLAALEEKASQPESVKPFKSFLDKEER